MRFAIRTAALILWVGIPCSAVSQQPAVRKAVDTTRAEVLVLGVYHMASPGRDIANMQVDDVLSPRRQREIAELVAVLKTFNPTRIAVEAPFDGEVTSRRYSDYLAGKYELTRDETQQIGFRLARDLGHKMLYPVDVDGEFPYSRLQDYVKAHDRSSEFDALMAEIRDSVNATNAYLSTHSVLETLLSLNSDQRVAFEVGHYYRMAHFSEPWNWAGADLLADWFRRNIRIYANVARLAASPNDRVLVIYGSGHTGWLRHNFASDPTFRVRKLAEFVK